MLRAADAEHVLRLQPKLVTCVAQVIATKTLRERPSRVDKELAQSIVLLTSLLPPVSGQVHGRYTGDMLDATAFSVHQPQPNLAQSSVEEECGAVG